MELYRGMPHHPMHSPFLYQMLRTHGDLMYGDGATAAVDIFGMSCHTGTHLDGLGHFAKNLCLHGGVPVSEGQSKTEGLNLDELSRARVSEFLLVMVPLTIRGGTASPVRPLAVV